jgi:hypothetical protein
MIKKANMIVKHHQINSSFTFEDFSARFTVMAAKVLENIFILSFLAIPAVIFIRIS